MKNKQFRDRPKLAVEKEVTQIPTPKVNHVSRGKWQNDAAAAYHEIFGTTLAEAPNDLAIPFPKSSFFESFKLGLKTSFLKTIFSVLSFLSKERGTHQNGGVGAKGVIRFLQTDGAKKLKFCDSAIELPVILRHSNASFDDDACSQLRAMAFRIERSNGQVDDFLFSTGAIIPFWSVTSLMNFANHRKKVKGDNWESQKDWLKNSPTAFIAAMESIRLAPSSYSKMSYYSTIPYGIEGTNEFVKFRVIPLDLDVESGLLNSEQQRRIWIQNRLDDNDKPQHYLADEYKERIGNREIIYHLEAQFRTLSAKDTDEFFNLARYWDDVLYPWEPIAELSARAVIPDEETQELAYWLGNIPEGLDLVKAISADDYNSVAESRIKIYPRPQRMRRKK
jgi:arachidonate 5-lipoxygenase